MNQQMPSRDERERRRLVLDEVRQDPEKRQSVQIAIEQALSRVATSLRHHRQRIVDESFEDAQRHMDAFIFAAHQLSAIARLMNDMDIDSALALEEFESKTAHLKTARDAFSHYEDYLLGIGQTQKVSDDPLGVFYSRSASAGTAVHLTNPSVVFDVGEAIDATEVLVGSLIELLHQSGVSVFREG